MYFSAYWHIFPTQQEWRRGQKCRSYLYNPKTHLPHPQNPKKSGLNDRFLKVLFSLPSPTRKLKSRPFRTCFLGLGVFSYLAPSLPHFRTQKTQSKWLGFIIIPPISSPHPKTQNTSISDVFWVWVGSFTFPHTYPTSTTQKKRSFRPLFEGSALPALPHPKT